MRIFCVRWKLNQKQHHSPIHRIKYIFIFILVFLWKDGYRDYDMVMFPLWPTWQRFHYRYETIDLIKDFDRAKVAMPEDIFYTRVDFQLRYYKDGSFEYREVGMIDKKNPWEEEEK